MCFVVKDFEGGGGGFCLYKVSYCAIFRCFIFFSNPYEDSTSRKKKVSLFRTVFTVIGRIDLCARQRNNTYRRYHDVLLLLLDVYRRRVVCRFSVFASVIVRPTYSCVERVWITHDYESQSENGLWKKKKKLTKRLLKGRPKPKSLIRATSRRPPWMSFQTRACDRLDFSLQSTRNTFSPLFVPGKSIRNKN